MDLNQKYADHQKAMIRAANAGSIAIRDDHLAAAATIAHQIERFQLHLGAAASCAWSAAQFATRSLLVENGRMA